MQEDIKMRINIYMSVRFHLWPHLTESCQTWKRRAMRKFLKNLILLMA